MLNCASVLRRKANDIRHNFYEINFKTRTHLVFNFWSISNVKCLKSVVISNRLNFLFKMKLIFVITFCIGSFTTCFASYEYLFQCLSCAVNKHHSTWVWVTFNVEKMSSETTNRANLVFAENGQFSLFSQPLLPKNVYAAVMTFAGRIRAQQ